MPEIDPAIVQVLESLAREDPNTGHLAGTALTWVTGGGGAGRITQERVQRFLWYDLPIKLRPTPEGRAAMTGALAAALELLGLPRYAQLCRSDVTAQVHAAYSQDPQSGLGAFRTANLESGIYPLDLPEFRWGAAMGLEEAKALAGVQDFLELAVASGELEPGARGWRAKQRRLVRKYLSAPNFQLGGQTPLDVMNTERIQNWIRVEPSETRQRLLSGLANRLLHPVQLPAGIEDPFPALTGLLRHIEGAGSCPDDRAEVLAIAKRLRLVRTVKARLAVTRRAKALTGNPAGHWRIVPEVLLEGNPYQRLSGEVLLALLIGAKPHQEEVLATIRQVAGEANYREAGTGQPPSLTSITKALEPTLVPMNALDLFRTGHPSAAMELTAAGQVVALEALRCRATGPPAAPWS